MKHLFQKTVIASLSLFVATHATSVLAKEQSTVKLENEEQKVSYATGSSFGALIKEAVDSKKLALDPQFIINGFTDSIQGKSQITRQDAEKIIADYNQKIQAKEAEELKVKTEQNIKDGQAFRDEFAKQPNVHKTESGLLYKIEKMGDGAQPKATDTVEVNYRGKLIDVREFDSSYSRNKTAEFPLNGVIKGWTEGLQLIKEGGKITLVVPPELAYGNTNIPDRQERPGISPQSTLVFDVELIKVKPAPQAEQPAKKAAQ